MKKFTMKCVNKTNVITGDKRLSSDCKKCSRRLISADRFLTSSSVGASVPLMDKLRSSRMGNGVSAFIAIVLMVAIGGIFNAFISHNASAAASTLTISVADSISLDILPTGSSGTFATSSTTATNISVSTTHGTGYTLGVAASTANSNALINSTDSSKTIPSITSSVSESTFSSSSDYNNKWGYRPSKYNSADNTNYLQAPTSTSSTILDKTTAANSTARTYNIAIGARIDGSTASGTYSNTLVFPVTANPSVYSITYNANGGSGAPSNVSDATTSGTSVTLSSTTPTRTGHTFQGWCTAQVAVGAACSGTSYSAGSSWTIDQTAASSSLTLYARWTLNTYSLKINFAGSGVSSVQVRTASGTGGTLKGTVSSSGGSVSGLNYAQAYYIYPIISSGYEFVSWAKNSSTGTLSSTSTSNPTFTMGAGNGEVTVTGKVSIFCTSSDTNCMQYYTKSKCQSDASSSEVALTDARDGQIYAARYIAGRCWMVRNLAIGCNGSGGTYGSSISSKSLTSELSNVSTTWSTPTATFNSSNNSATSGYTEPAMQCSSTYGAWYNYVAVTAGTISGDNNRTSATKDICPSGWHLPTVDEFSLITSYKGIFSPVHGGFYSSGSLVNDSRYGYWWSNSQYGSDSRSVLYYIDGSFGTASGNRYSGLYVRCVRN